MKKLRIGLGLVLFIVLFLFSSCEEVSDALNPGAVQLNGEPFTVTTATLVGVSLQDNGHATISHINGKISSVRTLNLDFAYSPSLPLEGNYSYPMTEDSRKLDSWLTNFTVVEGTSSTSTNLESGFFHLTDNGENNYTVELDILMKDGTSFTGSYTGRFTVMLK